MNFTVGNVRITVSFLLAVGLCAGTLLPGHLLPLLWLAILLHECGHFIYIAAAGKKIGVICISLTGVRIKLAGDRMSRGQELLLNLSGPTVNLLLGSIMLTGKSMQSMRAAAVHWAVASATLLPLGNSDGTVIADILLECCCGKRADKEMAAPGDRRGSIGGTFGIGWGFWLKRHAKCGMIGHITR